MSWLLTRVRCQDHQTQRLALWQPWQDFAQNWRIQLAQQIHGSEVKFMAFLDLLCLNKLRNLLTVICHIKSWRRIFVLFNLLDFLVRLSYTSMASLVSLVPQSRVPCLAVCLEAGGSSKCQIEWWSSAPNLPTDNGGQVPFPVGKNSHWKYLQTTAAKPLIRVLLQKPIISTISSVSSLIFGPRPHLLCLQQLYGFDEESKAATKTMKTRRGRRYQSTFSNNWCNACEKARANVFSFWAISDLSGWILLGQYHEGSVLNRKLMKNQEASHWQWLTVSHLVSPHHVFKRSGK